MLNHSISCWGTCVQRSREEMSVTSAMVRHIFLSDARKRSVHQSTVCLVQFEPSQRFHWTLFQSVIPGDINIQSLSEWKVGHSSKGPTQALHLLTNHYDLKHSHLTSELYLCILWRKRRCPCKRVFQAFSE